MVRILAVLIAVVLSTGPALSGVATAIPASAAGNPKSFWAAVMPEFYGAYSKRQKCWLGKVDGKLACMRPHRLDTVQIDGATHYFLVTGGYETDASGRHDDCHACGGSLGLIVLRDGGGGSLELVARNSLVEPTGSWGAIPAEEQFRLQQIGPDAYGWTMESGYTGQGYTGMGETIYGLIGDKVADLGFINTHSDNGGACGDGMGACFSHSYEMFFDIRPDGARFSDIIVRKLDSTDAASPPSFPVPYDPKALRYAPPEALSALLGI